MGHVNHVIKNDEKIIIKIIKMKEIKQFSCENYTRKCNEITKYLQYLVKYKQN